MKIYEYDLPDGRTAFSCTPLNYALNDNRTLNTSLLPEEVNKDLTIVSGDAATNIMRILLREDKWLLPDQLVAYTKSERILEGVSADQSLCIYKNGEVLVWLGEKYEPLAELFSKKHKKHLQDYIHLIAFQSVLAQLAISSIQNEG